MVMGISIAIFTGIINYPIEDNETTFRTVEDINDELEPIEHIITSQTGGELYNNYSSFFNNKSSYSKSLLDGDIFSDNLDISDI